MNFFPTITLLTSTICYAQTFVDSSFQYTATAGEVLTVFSDEEIVAALYSDYELPKGFYSDARDLDNYTGVGYLTRASNRWKQICTDSLPLARQWFQEENNASSARSRLIGETETEKYFEFEIETVSPPHFLQLVRVHKCSYLDRSMHVLGLHPWRNRDFSGWCQGVLNFRPINRNTVREVAEYLWHNSPPAYKAMASFTRDLDTAVCHTIYMLSPAFQDEGENVWADESIPVPPPRRPAHVTLLRLEYLVNKRTGVILLDGKAIRTISVRDNPREIIGSVDTRH